MRNRKNKMDRKKKGLIILGVSLTLVSIIGGTVAGIVLSGDDDTPKTHNDPDPKDPVDPDPTDPTNPDPTDPKDPVDPDPKDPVDPDPTDPTNPDPTDPKDPDVVEPTVNKSIRPNQVKNNNERFFDDYDKTTIAWKGSDKTDLKDQIRLGISQAEVDLLKEKEYDNASEEDKRAYEADYARVFHIPRKYAIEAIKGLRRTDDGKIVLSPRSGGMIHAMGAGMEDTLAIAKYYQDDTMMEIFEKEKTDNPDNTFISFVSEIASPGFGNQKKINLGIEEAQDEKRIKKLIYHKDSRNLQMWNKSQYTYKVSFDMDPSSKLTEGSHSDFTAGNHMSAYFTEPAKDITLNVDMKYFGNLLVKTEEKGEWQIIQSSDGSDFKQLKKHFDTLYAVRFIVTPDAMDRQFSFDGKSKSGDEMKYQIRRLFFSKGDTTVIEETNPNGTLIPKKDIIGMRLVTAFKITLNRYFMDGYDMNVALKSGELDNIMNYVRANNKTRGFNDYYVDTRHYDENIVRSGMNYIKTQLNFSNSLVGDGTFGTGGDYKFRISLRGTNRLGVFRPYKNVTSERALSMEDRLSIHKKDSIVPMFIYNHIEDKEKYTLENTDITDYRAKPKLKQLDDVSTHELYHAIVDDYLFINYKIDFYNVFASWLDDTDPLKIGNDQTKKDYAYRALTDYFLAWIFHTYAHYTQLFLSFQRGERESSLTPSNINEAPTTYGDNARTATPGVAFNDKDIEKKFFELAKSLTPDGNLDKTFHHNYGDNLSFGNKTNETDTSKQLKTIYEYETILSKIPYAGKVKNSLYQHTDENITDKQYVTKIQTWLENLKNGLTNKQLKKTIKNIGGGGEFGGNLNVSNIWHLIGMPMSEGQSLVNGNENESNIRKVSQEMIDLNDATTLIRSGLNAREIKFRNYQINLRIKELEAQTNISQADKDYIEDLKYILENNKLKLPDGTESDLSYLWGQRLWKVRKDNRPVHPWKKYYVEGDRTTIARSFIPNPNATDDYKTPIVDDLIPEEYKDNETIREYYKNLIGDTSKDDYWGVAKERAFALSFKKWVAKAVDRQKVDKEWEKGFGNANDNGDPNSSRWYYESRPFYGSESPEKSDTASVLRTAKDPDDLYDTKLGGRGLVKAIISMFTNVDMISTDGVGDNKTDADLWEYLLKIIATNIDSTGRGMDQVKNPKLQVTDTGTSEKVVKNISNQVFVKKEEVLAEEKRNKKELTISNPKFAKGREWEFKRPKLVVVKFKTKDGKEIEEYVNMGYNVSLKDTYKNSSLPERHPNTYTPDTSKVNRVFGQSTNDYVNAKNYGVKQRNYSVMVDNTTGNKNAYTITNIPSWDGRDEIYGEGSLRNTNPNNGRWIYTIGVTSTSNVGVDRTYSIEILQDSMFINGSVGLKADSGQIVEIMSVRLLTDAEAKRGRIVTNISGNENRWMYNNVYSKRNAKTDFLSNETILMGSSLEYETGGEGNTSSGLLYADLRTEPVILNPNADKGEGINDKTPLTYTNKYFFTKEEDWAKITPKKWETTADTMEDLPYWYEYSVFDDQK